MLGLDDGDRDIGFILRAVGSLEKFPEAEGIVILEGSLGYLGREWILREIRWTERKKGAAQACGV